MKTIYFYSKATILTIKDHYEDIAFCAMFLCAGLWGIRMISAVAYTIYNGGVL